MECARLKVKTTDLEQQVEDAEAEREHFQELASQLDQVSQCLREGARQARCVPPACWSHNLYVLSVVEAARHGKPP